MSILMKNEFNQKEEHVNQASSYTEHLKPSNKKVRVGWHESAKAISMDGDDSPLAEFFNLDEEDLDW
jgi:hypothetical protein